MDYKKQFNLREQLICDGVEYLSDAELLAVFISSGNKNKSCLQIALDLLEQFGDLRKILNATRIQFQQISGFGIAKFAQMQAIKEICRRSDFIQLQKETQISDTKQTVAYLKRCLRDQKNETFSALFLDSKHRIIAYEELFTGTINTATIHPRPIIERVLHHNAAAIILAHNHPSGVSDASEQDIAVTERIRDALDLVDTRLLDHVVIGDNEVYSIVAERKW